MTDQRHDKEFEAFLSGESELDDRYGELGHEEPPPEIDARILAEAREAANVHQAEFGPRGGWLKPAALAATVLLSFSLVMNVVVDTPTRFEQVAGPPESPGRRTAERSEAKPTEAETKLDMLQQPSASAGEEIMITAHKRSGATPQVREDTVMDMPMAAPAPDAQTVVSAADREAALAIVADYIANADSGLAGPDERAPGFERQAGRNLAATAVRESRPDSDAAEDPESLLRDIQHLHAEGDVTKAGRLLDEFLERYPGHPVSVTIRRQGD